MCDVKLANSLDISYVAWWKKLFPFGVRMRCDNIFFFFNKQTSWHMNVFHAWHEKYFKKESSSRRSAEKEEGGKKTSDNVLLMH